MAEGLSGGCLCGAVRYKISADPLFAGRCYCEDCRRTSGSGHNAVIGVPENTVEIKGKLTEYKKTGGSGQPITRRFCPTCGSKITASAVAMPGVMLVAATSLDDPEKFACQMSIFVSRAPSWDQPPGDAPTFPELPPQPG